MAAMGDGVQEGASARGPAGSGDPQGRHARGHAGGGSGLGGGAAWGPAVAARRVAARCHAGGTVACG